jgi:AraC-like DNA-binding protein
MSGMTKHTHDYMQIWYVEEGSFIHYINGTSNRLSTGCMFVIPPFVTHEIGLIAGENVKIYGCEFLANFINENISLEDSSSSLFDFAYIEPFLVTNENVLPRLHLAGKSMSKVEELFINMLAEYTDEKKYYEINIKADLLKLLAVIAREYENQDDIHSHEIFYKYRQSVKAAITFINENYTEKIYIEDVCKIALMSHTYFSYLFKQITGKTFVEYVNKLRIAKAVELLTSTDMPIGDICLLSGFNDTAYFIKVFKKETGISPRQYRKNNIEE